MNEDALVGLLFEILNVDSHNNRITNMIKALIIIGICLLTQSNQKRVTKHIKLKDFSREGPFIFLTKMQLGLGNSQVDITYKYIYID